MLLRRTLQAVQKMYSTSRNASSSSAPATLEAALVRIAQLEATLQGIAQVVRRKTGVELSEFLQEGKESLAAQLQPSLPTPPLSTPSSLSAPAPAPEPSAKAEEPFDISPLVLKALAVRKNLASGALREEEGEEEVVRLCEGLSVDHRRQVRDWAGVE